MARTKISEFSATAADNTDIDSIDIAEGCAPSGINNAIRELMAQLKDFQTGAGGDSFTTANLAYTGTLTGGTGIINIGSGQVYKDASGNVGVGTASPVSFGRFAVQTDGGTGVAIVGYSPSTTNGARLVLADNYSSAEVRSVPVAATLSSDMVFRTNNADRLRLDASGNLGLGVTPSAWGGSSALQIGNASLSFVTSIPTGVWLRSNSYFDGTNNRYIVTGAAATYRQNGGIHIWETVPSGTAGNAISFTQAMTLDADGELGIGIVAPNEKLHVSGAGKFTGQANSLDQSGAIIDYASSIARITGTGASGGTLAFFTNPNGGFQAERARIDSSGNLLVGTQSPINASYRMSVVGAFGIYIKCTDAVSNPLAFLNSAGNLAGYVQISGTTTSYVTSSDYRLKENVAPMTGALEKVAALKPCTYTWKADGSNGQGFIAHELQAVVPDCVTGEKDAVDVDGKPQYQGVDTSFLVATLVAAIQEQQATIAAMETRLAALEA